jgi:hypothetical protein
VHSHPLVLEVTPSRTCPYLGSAVLDRNQRPMRRRREFNDDRVAGSNGAADEDDGEDAGPCGQLNKIEPGLMKATLERDAAGRLIRKAADRNTPPPRRQRVDRSYGATAPPADRCHASLRSPPSGRGRCRTRAHEARRVAFRVLGRGTTIVRSPSMREIGALPIEAPAALVNRSA